MTILGVPEQALVEERALTLFASPEIASARQDLLALFRADRNAKLLDQEALIVRSVEEHLFHGCLVAANETPHDPRFVWSITPAHDWMGKSIPGSRFGQDNTDNIYRVSTIDPACSYRIKGRFAGPLPIDFSICALPAQIGEHMAADVVGFINMALIDIADDGSFTIDADPTATDGRRNHLDIGRAKSLMVRDTMADWSVERPSSLTIERTDAPAEDRYDPKAAAARAADLIKIIAGFFLDKIQHGMFEVDALNHVPVPVPSGARGGLITQCATGGYFRLGDEEALVITTDRLGAGYLGVQNVDMWMISYEYRNRTSSLNHTQAVADADGKFRFIVCASDPGAWNWLDSSGNACGSLLFRWQNLPTGVELAGCISSEVVRLDALRDRLPPETRYVDAAGREAQRDERYRGYMCRLTA